MYGLFPLLLFIRLLLLAVAGASNSVAQKMYICDNTTKACILHKGEVISSDIAMAQSTCLMICAGGSIWPYPTGFVSIDEAYAAFYIDKVTIHFGTDGDAGLTSEFLKLSSSIKAVFLDGLRDIQKSQYSLSNDGTEGAALTITVKITDPSVTAMTLRVEESYSLVITRTSSGSSSSDGGKIEVIITAETLFGARHGMETLRQLISWDELLASLVVASGVQILKDKPSFPYRGAMIDISRSFIPIDKLKNAVRALSFNKMNVLHLHLSDTAAFPLEIKKQPNVTFFGAYSEKDMILQDEMIDFVQFSNSLGVMIIPEIDGPAHVSSGFEWGVGAGFGDLIVCADPDGTEDGAWHRSSLEPASGQINLANDNFYTIMRDVYSELANIFSLSEYFHVGGDEIIVGGSDESAVSCYNNSVKSPDIISLLESNGLDRNSQESFYALWQNYTYKVSDLVEKAFQPHKAIKKLHIWGGGGDDETGTVYNLMTREDATTVLPPARYNVQVWDESKGSIVPDLTAKGYDVILSNTDYVYLDCGSSGWIHPGGYWCQPYHEWYKIYEYINDVVSMWELTSDQLVHVIGSETLAWSELIDATNIEQKMWPRTAALAEALWGRVSAEKTATWYRADPRMQHWRTVLVQRGVNAEPLQTKWCQQRGAYACSLDQGIPQ